MNVARRDSPTIAGTAALTAAAMAAFACNSLLCRLALKATAIDPASFTTTRLVAGAFALWLIVRLRRRGDTQTMPGDWTSAVALFAYAAAFSFAYVSLPASTGALLLFGAVQATMIGQGLRAGESFSMPQLAGLVLALGGLVGLLAPGLSAPPMAGALTMLAAGVAWGVYSLRGKSRSGDPLAATAGNFLRAVPFALALSVLASLGHGGLDVDTAGLAYAVVSGALASGVGYAVWYTALPSMRATTAATVQLSVPVLTALAGILLLDEPLTSRLLLASTAILGGIALVIRRRAGPEAIDLPAVGNLNLQPSARRGGAMNDAMHDEQHGRARPPAGPRTAYAGESLNRMAAIATLHCLLGCAIGEVIGLLIGTALGWSNAATIGLAVVLAFLSGFALTAVPFLRRGYTVRQAARIAFAADAVSITIMEIVDNALMLAIPGAMDAPVASLRFWSSMALALAVAGVAAYPVNRWLIARGKGHAAAHRLHHDH